MALGGTDTLVLLQQTFRGMYTLLPHEQTPVLG